ncbi:Mfa1 family fimbria major subunit [Porphyromonadaceae bacterium W3.11]|nr:Mfa1 family fimbria major subunit [Porphyromonadaceae bacterium W3.11]
MKLNKLFLIGALALGIGLASCDNKGQAPSEPSKGQSVGDTYIGLSLRFPTDASTRAGSDDYNKIPGQWTGRDAIESITVYLVTEGVGVSSEHFEKGDFNGIDQNGYLTPKLAVEAKSGEKVKAYVVINDVKGKVSGALNIAGWPIGQKVEETTKSTSGFESAFSTAIEITDVADVAVYDLDKSKDKILMTNKELPTAGNKGQIEVKPNVSQEQAKQGLNNRIEIEVTRVASRAIVTIAKDATKEIKVQRKNLTDGAIEETATVTITEVKYAATGGALWFNPIEKAQTPDKVYNFIPKGDTWNAVKQLSNGIFEYKDGYQNLQVIDGAVNETNLAAALGAEKFSKFLLPVNHEENNYKKGNTPFFTIQATFTVKNNLEKYPNADKLEDLKDGTVYFGKVDGLFYSTKAKAQLKDATSDKKTVEDADVLQDVVEYKSGKMYYNIWINPDVPYTDSGKIKKSPVYRNQVYNAHITGFKEIGLSWTPNNDPDDPDDNEDPEDPNPFDPDDDLETDKTYLSVQLKVLPYTLHSYTVNLGNRY